MRFLTTLIIGTALALPAVAQTTPHHGKDGLTPKQMMRRGASQTGYKGHPTENDKGPFTPEANKAYDGGGAILVGRPGEGAPPASAVSQQPQGQPLPPAAR